MTNKTLSQRLCEVCGFKPYYGIYVNFGDLDNNYKLVTNKRKYRLIADCRYIVDNEDELKNLEPKYLPDFENNNDNFVKLGELKIKTTKKYHTLFEMLSLECNFVNKKDFLDFLVDHINDKKYYSGSYIFTFRDIIKKSIKNEQWEV